MLDLLGNSVRARAKNVTTHIEAVGASDLLTIRIQDDGCGMERELLSSVADPFRTTRTTRAVGLGVPLFKEASETTGGTFRIDSEPGRGTLVEGSFRIGHIDRLPLGDLGATFSVWVRSNPCMDFTLILVAGERRFEFRTEEIRRELGIASLDEPDVLAWIEARIEEGQRETFLGILPEMDR